MSDDNTFDHILEGLAVAAGAAAATALANRLFGNRKPTARASEAVPCAQDSSQYASGLSGGGFSRGWGDLQSHDVAQLATRPSSTDQELANMDEAFADQAKQRRRDAMVELVRSTQRERDAIFRDWANGIGRI